MCSKKDTLELLKRNYDCFHWDRLNEFQFISFNNDDKGNIVMFFLSSIRLIIQLNNETILETDDADSKDVKVLWDNVHALYEQLHGHKEKYNLNKFITDKIYTEKTKSTKE